MVDYEHVLYLHLTIGRWVVERREGSRGKDGEIQHKEGAAVFNRFRSIRTRREKSRSIAHGPPPPQGSTKKTRASSTARCVGDVAVLHDGYTERLDN